MLKLVEIDEKQQKINSKAHLVLEICHVNFFLLRRHFGARKYFPIYLPQKIEKIEKTDA